MNNTIKLPFFLKILRKFDFPKKLGILEYLYGAYLHKEGVCWVVCSNEVKWKLNLTDACHRWIVFGYYEGGLGIRYAASQLQKGSVYVDSGANVGQWLLYLGGIPGLKTLAFEPVDSERKWLKECLSDQPKWDYEIVSCGLGSEKTQSEIQVDGSRSTLNMNWYAAKGLQKMTISIQRLDDVLREKNISKVDFWKLDVEGAELEALKGAKEMLNKQKIKCIYFECHPTNYKAIIELMNLYGYSVFDLRKVGVTLKTDSEIPNTQDLVAMPRNLSSS